MRLTELLGDAAPGASVVDAGSVVAGIPEGFAVAGVTVLLLEEPVGALPLGRLVELVCSTGAEVLAVAGVEEPGRRSAVVLAPRSAAPAARWRRVEGRGLVPVSGAAAVRDEVETVLLAAVLRDRALALRDEAGRERSRADAAEGRERALRADVVKVTADLAALRASRTYEVGLALQEVRRRPVAGLAHLPRALRRAGKGSAPR